MGAVVVVGWRNLVAVVGVVGCNGEIRKMLIGV